MEQALYRKYRPRSLDEVVGQEPITRTLSNAIKTGKISHAYLFTGPRGVGKTTVARILAHEVNQLPYTDESIHLDIIEIDGASNRRIEEVRDLRDKVHTTPSSAKYKVYIIDEVHMLTKEAFNALLKTLEEPPAHCIFILATTEVHKLPETIISRTQHFTFSPIGNKHTVEHLKALAKRERIQIEPGALDLLAEFGEGSFRDSINLLDQLSSSKSAITSEDIAELAGIPSKELISSLLQSVEQGNPGQSLQILSSLQNQGITPKNVSSALSAELRHKIIDREVADKTWISKLLKDLLEVSSSKNSQDVLEVVLLESATRLGENALEPVPKSPTAKHQVSNEKNELKVEEPIEKQKEETPMTDNRPLEQFDLSKWDEILGIIKQKSGPLYTALRLAEPSLEGSELSLHFEFNLHQKKVSESGNIALIEQIIKDYSGERLKIVCLLDKSLKKAPTEVAELTEANDLSPISENLQTISNIFGQTEMLES